MEFRSKSISYLFDPIKGIINFFQSLKQIQINIQELILMKLNVEEGKLIKSRLYYIYVKGISSKL